MIRRTAALMRGAVISPVLLLLACGDPLGLGSGSAPERRVDALVLSAPDREAKTGRPIPVRVRAVDRYHEPVPDASVSLVIVAGEASFEGHRSEDRRVSVTTGSDGSVEVGVIPWSGGSVSVQAFVSGLAHTGVRLDLDVTLRILLVYDIGEAYEYFGYDPGFFVIGRDSILPGDRVEWSCSCDHEWGVVGLLTSGDTVFDSGSLDSYEVFRWSPEDSGVHEYRDPVGGASAELTVMPVLIWP